MQFPKGRALPGPQATRAGFNQKAPHPTGSTCRRTIVRKVKLERMLRTPFTRIRRASRNRSNAVRSATTTRIRMSREPVIRKHSITSSNLCTAASNARIASAVWRSNSTEMKMLTGRPTLR